MGNCFILPPKKNSYNPNSQFSFILKYDQAFLAFISAALGFKSLKFLVNKAKFSLFQLAKFDEYCRQILAFFGLNLKSPQ